MSLFNELKRRNVFKVAAAYVIVSWLLLQVSDTLVPALHLPEWFHSGVAFVLMIGFPLAIIFAWAFELTPEGIKKEKEVDPTQSITHTTGQKLNYAIIALMSVALAYFVWDKFLADPENEVELAKARLTVEQNGTATKPHIQKPDKNSIAVLPFQNRSANEENAEFFADGIHDELLTNLSKIGALKVISRTSVMNYRDNTRNLRQIGKELGVANVLEGGVQRAGSMVRINVQLIDAATDEHLWAEVYDRQLTTENLFAIQTEIANAIADALEATLSPREKELLAIVPTDNLEAFDNWVIARHLLNRGNWKDMYEAQTYLQKAIEIDPGFVQAHVLLADTFASLYATGATLLEENRAPWEKAIQTALSLDKNSASALASYAKFQWANGIEGADKTLERARQLEPGNVDIITIYADYLRSKWHPDRALPLYQMARELDPISIPVLFGMARSYQALDEPDKALEIFTRIRQIDPASIYGIGPACGPYIAIGALDQCLPWIFKAMLVDPDDYELPAWIVRGYMDFGDLHSAHRWLNWIESKYDTDPMALSASAMIDVYEGNLDIAAKRARNALEGKMPERWGADAIMVRILLMQAVDRHESALALKVIRQAHPELFESSPRVDPSNITQAIDSAHLLQMENQTDEARKLLNAAIATFDTPYAMSGPYYQQEISVKAQALALLGEKQAAIAELRQRVDKGWRLFWRWHTELNPNFKSLREEPGFQAIVEFLRTDMARQLANMQAMEAAGEIPSPPGDSEQQPFLKD